MASLSDGDSRMSSVSGLNARPQNAIGSVLSARPTAFSTSCARKCACSSFARCVGLGHAHRDAVRAAEVEERLHVLREARPAVAGARVEESLADARVGADAEPNRVDVGARGVAEARELVHERDAHREHRVGRVLRELARARIGDDDALAGELQRRVESRGASRARPRCARRATTRSGRKKSWTASPSLRNSGFETTSSGTPGCRCASARACTASHVPTGTVLLTTTSAGFFAVAAMRSATASTALTSAAPSGPGGVPTAMKYASASSKAAATSVEN